jgi:hypothetical protein
VQYIYIYAIYNKMLFAQGHVKQILGIDFCGSGVQVATGSGDNTVCVC